MARSGHKRVLANGRSRAGQLSSDLCLLAVADTAGLAALAEFERRWRARFRSAQRGVPACGTCTTACANTSLPWCIAVPSQYRAPGARPPFGHGRRHDRRWGRRLKAPASFGAILERAQERVGRLAYKTTTKCPLDLVVAGGALDAEHLVVIFELRRAPLPNDWITPVDRRRLVAAWLARPASHAA
jgi:hypothetical protein